MQTYIILLLIEVVYHFSMSSKELNSIHSKGLLPQVPRCLAGLLLFGTEGLSFTGGWASPKSLEACADWATGAEGLQVLQCLGAQKRNKTLALVG